MSLLPERHRLPDPPLAIARASLIAPGEVRGNAGFIESHLCKKQGGGASDASVPPKQFRFFPQRVNIRRTATPTTLILSCAYFTILCAPGVGVPGARISQFSCGLAKFRTWSTLGMESRGLDEAGSSGPEESSKSLVARTPGWRAPAANRHRASQKRRIPPASHRKSGRARAVVSPRGEPGKSAKVFGRLPTYDRRNAN